MGPIVQISCEKDWLWLNSSMTPGNRQFLKIIITLLGCKVVLELRDCQTKVVTFRSKNQKSDTTDKFEPAFRVCILKPEIS